jgi:hypothetical protein
MVDRYGVFTVNFKPSVAIPLDQFVTLIATVIGAAWFLPILGGLLKTRTQLKHLKECINQIGKLDKNAMEDKMNGYYLSGKINEDQREFLKDKISEYYDSVQG